jgi:hypothetical protein
MYLSACCTYTFAVAGLGAVPRRSLAMAEHSMCHLRGNGADLKAYRMWSSVSCTLVWGEVPFCESLCVCVCACIAERGIENNHFSGRIPISRRETKMKREGRREKRSEQELRPRPAHSPGTFPRRLLHICFVVGDDIVDDNNEGEDDEHDDWILASGCVPQAWTSSIGQSPLLSQ